MSSFLPTLTERRSPWVTFTSSADPWVAEAEAELRARGGIVLRLHGEELHEKGCMFRAFARELGFPGYFGHNWNALVDCLGDWHGPGHGEQDVAVLIDGADTLLDVEFLGVLVSVLCDGAWRANFMVDLDGEPHSYGSPFALHFVFLLDHVAPADFTEAAASDEDVSAAVVDGRLLLTLTAWGGDPVWPPAGDDSPTTDAPPVGAERP
ncbi:barstar family protein [Streptomyces virginiae]|uniref:barstar family protein n=1 Tax=Streptomyces virginiae TaxID=1961 RepID=UPI00224D4D04|nr:barstar family protein [Streptomyces virginiae]MCX4720911.1 barstar family protein [Streptomyces virginiae]MCX5270097.1 barstar family protein [Streptomyces virginiae]